jgi:hypothetical protein
VAVEPQQISIPVPKFCSAQSAILVGPDSFQSVVSVCSPDRFPCHIWGTICIFFEVELQMQKEGFRVQTHIL